MVEVRQRFDDVLDFVAAEDIDLSKRVVVETKIIGPLVPAYETHLSFTDGDLHFRARSSGRSLVVVPLEYSRCIELRTHKSSPLAGTISLHRVNGLLTGVLFDYDADIVLAFRTGPLHNPLCRLDDYLELRTQFGVEQQAVP
jgi:hypothetical protein